MRIVELYLSKLNCSIPHDALMAADITVMNEHAADNVSAEHFTH